MKKPIDMSQNCACGACGIERAKYQKELKEYKKWLKSEEQKKVKWDEKPKGGKNGDL